MNTPRLIIVGAGIVLVLGIAVRATRELNQTKAALSTLASQCAAVHEKIAQTEERLRAAPPAVSESKQASAAAREEPEGTNIGTHAVALATPVLAKPEAAARQVNPQENILRDPKQMAAYCADLRATLDVTYGGMFKALGLSPEMIEKFKDCQVATQLGWLEFRAVADAHEVDWNSPGREALRQKQMQMNSAKLAEVLGPLWARYRQYGRTQNVRDLVQRLASTGAYLETPVTSAQVERVTDILIANAKPREKNAFRGWAINWDASSVQLQEVLAPAQIATLGLFVQEQEAGVKVTQRIIRLTAQFQGKPPPN